MFKKLFLFCLLSLSLSADIESNSGKIAYYEMRSFNIWPYLRYDEAPYGTIDTLKVEAFFQEISQEIKKWGLRTIYLSTAQLCDISNYFENNFQGGEDRSVNFSSKDTLGDAMGRIHHAQAKFQIDPSLDLMALLLEGFHKNGVKVNLSFGGSHADIDDFILREGSVEEKQTQLIALMDKYQIDGLDFNFHLTLPIECIESLKNLSYRLKEAGKKVFFTLPFSLVNDSKNGLRELLLDSALFETLNFITVDNQESDLKEVKIFQKEELSSSQIELL